MASGSRIRLSAFSLVELLVAVGVISILLALILPAIQRSRAAARRAQCQSNLRQMGLSLHSYHDLHSAFPPGYSPSHVGGGKGVFVLHKSAYAWGAHLLPFLEQVNLYNSLDINRTGLEEFLEGDPKRARLVETQLPVFRCPDDLAEETLETAPLKETYRYLNLDFDGRVSIETPLAGASASYVGNSGYYGTHHPAAATPNYYRPALGVYSSPNNGLFWAGSHTTMASITDGASQTIAIGERAWFQGSATWVGTAFPISRSPGGTPVSLGRVYWRINELPDPPGVLITPKNKLEIRHHLTTARSGFSSYHIGGANFLFADGSVRFLHENMDHRTTTDAFGVDVTDAVPDAELLGVFQRLGIRNDGLPAGSGF